MENIHPCISTDALVILKNFTYMPYLPQLPYWFSMYFYVFIKFYGFLYPNLEVWVVWWGNTKQNSRRCILKINLTKNYLEIYTICISTTGMVYWLWNRLWRYRIFSKVIQLFKWFSCQIFTWKMSNYTDKNFWLALDSHQIH